MPHFFVDDAFSDSKEVLAIPARYRLASVGLWTLCGSWSASKLTDGYTPNGVVCDHIDHTETNQRGLAECRAVLAQIAAEKGTTR